MRNEELVNGVWQGGVIEDVLVVPRAAKNLFSVGVCTAKGFRVGFKDEFVKKDLVNGLSVKNAEEFFCEAWLLKKLQKLPFTKETKRVGRKPGNPSPSPTSLSRARDSTC